MLEVNSTWMESEVMGSEQNRNMSFCGRHWKHLLQPEMLYDFECVLVEA